MNKLFIAASAAMLTILAISCSKETNNPTPPPISYEKIAEGYAAGAGLKATIYATSPTLTTGYNKLWVALSDSITGAAVTNATLSFLPMMDMTTMQHSAPTEPFSAANETGLFSSAVVFTMPSGSMGSWTLKLNVQHNSKSGSFTTPVNISAADPANIKTFISKADGKKYIVSLIQPAKPKVGINDFEIAVFQSASMMSFPADSSMTVIVDPQMPTMGHGSPNNTNPAHIGKGHYKGQLNFTMTGLWHVNMKFMQESAVADTSSYFEINF